MTTYYVSYSTGSDSDTGLSEELAWKSCSKASTTPVAGDTVLFNRGETWPTVSGHNAIINPTNNGTAGNLITYSAYGTGARPIIDGRGVIADKDEAGDWTDNTGNVWYAAETTNPYRLWLSDVEYMKAASVATVNSTNRWYWSTNVLYVYATSNPASFYTSVKGPRGIGDGNYTTPLRLYGKSYIEVSELDLRGGVAASADIKPVLTTPSQYIYVHDCNIGMYGETGVAVWGTATTGSDHVYIYDNIINGGFALSTTGGVLQSGGDGIRLQSGTYHYAYGNTISGWWHDGLNFYGFDTPALQYCEMYNNTITGDGTTYCRAFDMAGTADDRCAYNKLYNNTTTRTTQRSQLQGNNNEIYGNVIETDSGSHAVVIGASSGSVCHDLNFHDNVIKKCPTLAFLVQCAAAGASTNVYNITVASNIFSGCAASAGTFSDGRAYGAGVQIAIHKMDGGGTMGANTWTNNIIVPNAGSDAVSWYAYPSQDDRTVAEFNALTGTNDQTISGNVAQEFLLCPFRKA